MAMTIEKLIAASQRTIMTKEAARKLDKRLADAEKRFAEEDSEKHDFPPGFLDREFTL